jgi:hypothetical protein
VSEPGGTVQAIVSAPGYLPAEVNTTVSPGRTQYLNVSLSNDAELVGSVHPIESAVALDGASVAVNFRGDFLFRVAPGTYGLNASKLDHVTDFRSVTLLAGTVTEVDLSLAWSVGWITGTVTPENASLSLGGVPFATRAGAFNDSLLPGIYAAIAVAPGRAPWNASIVVTAGRATPEVLVLTPAASTSPIIGTNPSGHVPPASSMIGAFFASSIAPLVMVGSVLVVALVVWIAVVRRRRS